MIVIQFVLSLAASFYFVSGVFVMIHAVKNPDPRNLLNANSYAHWFLIGTIAFGSLSLIWLYSVIKAVLYKPS